jgi:hypothetical protein
MTSLVSAVPRIASLLNKTFCCEVGFAGSALSGAFISVFDVFHKSVSSVSDKNLFNIQSLNPVNMVTGSLKKV